MFPDDFDARYHGPYLPWPVLALFKAAEVVTAPVRAIKKGIKKLKKGKNK